MGLATAVIENITDVAGLVMQTNENRAAFDINHAELKKGWLSEDLAATDAFSRGAREAGMARQRGSQVLGTQRVAFAQNQVDSSSGTAAKLAEATDYAAEQDATTIKANALAEALGHQQTAQKYRTENTRQRMAVENAYASSYFALAGKTLAKSVGFAGGM